MLKEVLLISLLLSALQKMKKKMEGDNDVMIEGDDDVMIVDNAPCQTTNSHSFAIKIRLPSGVKKFQIKPVFSMLLLDYLL